MSGAAGEEAADAALLAPPSSARSPPAAKASNELGSSESDSLTALDAEGTQQSAAPADGAAPPSGCSVWLSLPYLQSYVYFSLYIALGLAVGSTGPTLELLARNTNSTMDEVGMVFTARGIGWIGGSVIAGACNIFELSWIGPHRVMLISAAALSAYLLLLPLVTHLWLLLSIALISSVFCSWIDVGANALIFAVWKEKVGPWMQALHFFFGIGASIAPAIIALVLRWCAPERQLLVAAYSLAFLSIFTALLPLVVPSPRVGKQEGDAHGADANGKPRIHLSRRRELLLVVMTALFLFFYVGIESAYGGWIYLYARENFPLMPEWEAASLSSAFWIAITAGRLLAVPLTIYLPNRRLLLLDLVLCLPVGVVLASASRLAILQSRLVLWAMTFLYGAGMASIYATAFSLPSEQGLEITSSASSWFIVGGSSGDMAVPAALGFLVVRWSSALAWAVLGASVALLILYFALVGCMEHWTRNPTEGEPSAEAPLSVLSEKDEQKRGLTSEEGDL